MSYIVLARKSRPQTFSEVVGQRAVVQTLQNSIARKRVAHALLFSGVRGVGKTTLARIMAKAVNCSAETDSPPCNSCPSCTEITAGSALDLLEIDGASNRGIQEIRELKDKIKYLPTSSRYKVIIIDEVHMLTTEAFNALLKTLEEPPEHIYFIFATTELHKIPITILSRCQQYELKRISANELSKHFAGLAEKENIAIEPAALSLIVREAAGSVRDGLSLLDQVFSFTDSDITVSDVTEVLGLVDREILFQLCSALLAGDASMALKTLEQVFTFGMDIKRFSADLLENFRTLLLTKIEGCLELVDLPREEVERFIELGSIYSSETIHQKLNLLMTMVENVRYSSLPRLEMETGFLKIIEASNVVGVGEVIEKLNTLLDTGELPLRREPPPEPPPTQPVATTDPKKKSVAEFRLEPTTITADAEPPTPQQEPPPIEDPEPATANMVTDSPPLATASASEEAQQKRVEIHAHEKDIRKHWPDFLKYVGKRKLWMAQDLDRATVRDGGTEIQLHYDDPAQCALLRQKGHKNELSEFVLDFFQRELTLHFILPDAEDLSNNSGEKSPQQKRQQLANDPLTVMATEVLNGQVGDVRIGPKSR